VSRVCQRADYVEALLKRADEALYEAKPTEGIAQSAFRLAQKTLN